MNDETKKDTEYKDWYEVKGDEYNKNRKKRYRDDPEYRQQCIDSAREYREKLGKGHVPNMTKEVIFNGELITVYLISYVMRMVGRSRSTILLWEKSGYIPKPTVQGKWRMYTFNQFNLIYLMSNFFYKYSDVRSSLTKTKEFNKLLSTIKDNWET